MSHRSCGSIRKLSLVLCIGSLVIASHAVAGPYSQLQVLLPGEVEAPGTAGGKVGAPAPQTVGIPFDVRVRACDSNWETVTTVTHQLRFGSSDASASLPPDQALSSGVVDVQVTLNAGGSFTVSATDQTDPSIPEATSATVQANAVQGFAFTRINQKNQDAGVPMSIDIWAIDANGDLVPGFNGPVSLRQLTSFGEGRIEPAVITLSGGEWSGAVTNFRADESSINRGNVNIEARLESNPGINGLSDPFVVHPGPFARVHLVVPGQSPWPGSVTGVSGAPAAQSAGQNFTAEVYATDLYWNPVPGIDAVRITSSDAGASTPVSGSLTDGFVQLDVALATVGMQTLTVVDQTNGSILGMTTDPIPVIAAAADHYEFDPITGPVVAGQAVAVTIRATDADNNTITDFAGDARLAAVTGPGTISPELVSFTSGVWTGAVTLRGAGGAVSLTCSDFSSPPHTGTSVAFEVVPGPMTGLQVLMPGQTPQGGADPGYGGTPSAQSAGAPFSITVRAVDAFWNRVPGNADRIALSSSDPFAMLPADTVLANGELVLPITVFAAGTQTVTATDLDDAGVLAHTSSSVDVAPGPYAALLLLAPGEVSAPGSEEGRVGAATDQSINYAFAVEVYATDAWFNPVIGVSDVVHLTSSDTNAELPLDAPLVDGALTAAVRLRTGGFQQLFVSSVSQPAVPMSTTQVRAISSGFHLEAVVTPTLVEAGAPFQLTVSVRNDAGSIISEVNSAVTVEVRNAISQEDGRGDLEVTSFQLLAGQRVVTETYTAAEPIVLVVSDDGGNEPAVSDVIVVEPAPPTLIQLSSDPAWARANRQTTISAAVVDAFGNGVPAQPLAFEIVSGGGSLTPIDATTGDSGIGTADFLSPRSAGMTRIQVASNQITALLDVETALVDPNQPAGTLTNYPNPFHPGDGPTTIAYKLADDAKVTLSLYTLHGGLVRTERFDSGADGGRAGLNEYAWDGRNAQGNQVASGTYLLLINADGGGETLHTMRRRVAVVR